MPVFDWRPNWDVRNALFTIRQLDCYNAGEARRNIRRTKVVYLDQGREGACTGFGMEHVRALSPKRRYVSNRSARALYLEAQRQDEWPGEDYEGSSINGAMKAARLLGYIRQWRWARTMEEVRHGLSYHGAFEIGVYWWTGMMRPDSEGLVQVSGIIEGGHAIALSGYRTKDTTRQYRLENSWGQDWGQDGGCWINEFDLTQLMMTQGEFAIPLKN